MAKSNLQFAFDEDEKSLLATYTIPNEKKLIIDAIWIKNKLHENNYDNLELINGGIIELKNQINKGNPGDSGTIKVASKSDAKVEITVAEDKMSAYLTLSPPKGGDPINLDAIKKAFAEKGIRNGFIPTAIKESILSGEASDLCIAEADPLIQGEDATFHCLLPDMKTRAPQVNENGNVDYRDLGEIVVVHPGEKLMRREPATAGVPSSNIYGETVNPKRGIDHKFASGLDGVTTSEDDPNLLIATETGQPIVLDNGISIENTMEVENVNLTTGNIVFDGSVLIKGDVENGMTVKASGDINVLGRVESAKIVAGGDIVIMGAIIGRGELRDQQNQKNPETAMLEAKGSVNAKFIENAFIDSEDSIFIQDWVIKSELTAVNEIIVGNKNARKGQIIGGKVTSGILVKAMNIGSSAGTPTKIQVGVDSDIEQKFEENNREITRREKSLVEICKAFISLKNNPTKQAKEMMQKSLKAKKQLENEISNLRQEREILTKEKERINNVRLIVEKTIYSATTIIVGGIEKQISEDLGARVYRIEEGKLIQNI